MPSEFSFLHKLTSIFTKPIGNFRNSTKLLLALILIFLLLSVGFGYWLRYINPEKQMENRTESEIPSTATMEQTSNVCFGEKTQQAQKIPTIFAFAKSNDVGVEEIWIYDSGDVYRLVDSSNEISRYELSPDNNNLYYSTFKRGKPAHTLIGGELRKAYLETKKVTVLVSEAKITKDFWKSRLADFDLSNDGEKIVYARNGIWVLDLKTNKSTKILSNKKVLISDEAHQSRQIFNYETVEWTPSANFILATSQYPYSGDNTLLEFVNVSAKEVKSKSMSGVYINEDFDPYPLVVSDTRGIFGTDTDIVEKEFSNFKKDIKIGISDRASHYSYNPNDDRIYYFGISSESGDDVSITDSLNYFDRKTGKNYTLNKLNFCENMEVEGFNFTSDYKYILFNVVNYEDESDYYEALWVATVEGEVLGPLTSYYAYLD